MVIDIAVGDPSQCPFRYEDAECGYPECTQCTAGCSEGKRVRHDCEKIPDATGLVVLGKYYNELQFAFPAHCPFGGRPFRVTARSAS